MNMKKRTKYAGLGLLCLMSALPQAEAAPSVGQPNVLIILADDLGYGDLGYTGCKDILTPHIDRLAAQSVICTDGHVSGAVCGPSRAGLISGRYQQRVHHEYNSSHCEDDVVTLAHHMRDAGYTTMAVGKWHIGPDPQKVGFDHFTGLLGGSRAYFPQKKIGAVQRFMRDGKSVEQAGWTYLTDFMTEEGMRMLRGREKGKPFFLYMSYTTPHTPLHTREDIEARYAHIEHKGRRKYAAMVASLDEEVGQWLDFLEKEGLRENTIVVFFSDNGGATINNSNNGLWRGMKGSFWEGGQRVPFLVSWPGTLKPGWYNQAIISLDLTPTFLAAAGKPVEKSGVATDGVNLLPYLRDGKPGHPHELLYWRQGPGRAVREKDLIFIKTLEDNGSLNNRMLFDLINDPMQRENLAEKRPGDVARLDAFLVKWESELPEVNGGMAEGYRKNYRAKHHMDVIGRDAERRLP
jgi:arylsulfatase A-like enzyme